MTLADSNALDSTVVGNWHDELAHCTTVGRNHWRTRVAYYRSAAELVAARPGSLPGWRDIVDGVGPDGSRSTFYEIAGRRGRHRLIDELIGDGRNDAIQLALHYQRASPVQNLLDEAKVWSFWPHRERLVAILARQPLSGWAAEDALVGELRRWATVHSGLASALDHSPPACAAEDLSVLLSGRLAATRCVQFLAGIVRDTVGSTVDGLPRTA